MKKSHRNVGPAAGSYCCVGQWGLSATQLCYSASLKQAFNLNLVCQHITDGQRVVLGERVQCVACTLCIAYATKGLQTECLMNEIM